MLGQGFHTLPLMGWVPSSDWRFDNHAPASTLATADASWISAVPVEPATLLGLELLLQEESLGLQKASDLVLSDVGATLKILRLASSEYLGWPDEVCRMQDVLSSLGVQTWFGAITDHSTHSYRNVTEIRSVWQHCRLVGQYAKLISESLDGICGDLAYVAGLLHEFETMPQVLDPHFGETASSNLRLADVLPEPVLHALQSARERGHSSVWRYILSSAHALALATPPTHGNA